jgi:hypothetical protein
VNARSRFKLLFGPYRPPALQRGDRATCLFRDGDAVVTSWTDARISWPRCRAEGTHGGGSGLLVDEELARKKEKGTQEKGKGDAAHFCNEKGKGERKRGRSSFLKGKGDAAHF